MSETRLPPWKVVLFDLVIFAGISWIPVFLYWIGRVSKMPNPLIWLTVVLGVLLGPLQFALSVLPDYRAKLSVKRASSGEVDNG